jgi:hypothetical protein
MKYYALDYVNPVCNECELVRSLYGRASHGAARPVRYYDVSVY